MGKMSARIAETLTHICVCPFVNPAGLSHVGGPILVPGDPKVRINGNPAARIGDHALCRAPADRDSPSPLEAAEPVFPRGFRAPSQNP